MSVKTEVNDQGILFCIENLLRSVIPDCWSSQALEHDESGSLIDEGCCGSVFMFRLSQGRAHILREGNIHTAVQSNINRPQCPIGTQVNTQHSPRHCTGCLTLFFLSSYLRLKSARSMCLSRGAYMICNTRGAGLR